MGDPDPSEPHVLDYRRPDAGFRWKILLIVLACVLVALVLLLLWAGIEFGRQLPNQQ